MSMEYVNVKLEYIGSDGIRKHVEFESIPAVEFVRSDVLTKDALSRLQMKMQKEILNPTQKKEGSNS